MSLRPVTPGARGFSLVEVMVALIVMSVGLLGIARMQAVALSNTAVSSTRSLAAIEASSLAASMHVNRGYWASTSVAGTITIQGTTVSPAVAAPAPDCTAQCTPVKMAAYDLNRWAAAAAAVLPPDYLATITCAALATPTPPNCMIQIKWGEKAVALNSTAAAASSPTSAVNVPDYELYVEP